MPIVRRKDFTDLVARTKVRLGRQPHYLAVFLWRTEEALRRNTDLGPARPGRRTSGVHCCVPCWLDQESGEPLPRAKIGELHFVAGEWTVEVVSHEVMHGVIHRLRVCCPSPRQVFEHLDDMLHEEEICYDAGRWVREIYRWLWNVDHAANTFSLP